MRNRKALGRQRYREAHLLDNPHIRYKVEQRKEEDEYREEE
jgi:hypothetical protein